MQKSFTVDFWLGSKYGSWRYCQNIIHCTGWPTKMSLFFFGNNFYKNKETFKGFSPQLLEAYRILLVKTTLESIMFCYTFSLLNTMFVPCPALLYNSTAATRTLKLTTTLLSISCRIHVISGNYASGIQVFCSSNEVMSHFSNTTEPQA